MKTNTTWDLTSNANVELTEDGLLLKIKSSIQWLATNPKHSGKWYWEIQLTSTVTGGVAAIGVAKRSVLGKTTTGSTTNGTGITLYSTGVIYPNAQSTGMTFTAGDWIGVLLDLDNNTVGFKKGDTVNYSSYKMDRTEELLPHVRWAAGEVSVRANFGTTPFVYSIPEGYRAYDSKNNKSFILFEDGYKKLDEGSPAIGAVNVVPKMTSSTLPSGEVKTSSSHSAPYDGWKVFDRNVDTASRWIANGLTRPQWLQYDFGKEVVSSGYGLSPYSVANTTGWRFQAGNDGSNWIDLDTQSDQILTMGKTNYYGVQNIEGYRYYRFFFTEGSASESVMFNEIEILDSGKTATPLLWKTVSPILPTLPQFQSEGMDDLSVFNRKVQTVLESPQAMTSSVLGEGKVYKGTVDLKKYFDLRKLEVK